jgi:O-antigen ligase
MPSVVSDRRTANQWPAYAVVGLTVLAPAMGGSIELWAQSVLAIGAGLLMIFWPPRKSLGPFPNVAFAALLLLALAAFLPMRWFAAPDWWIDTLKLGVQLPATHSPQPWLTLQWSWFLFLGLTWCYYLLTFSWSRRLREKACGAFAIVILILSAALTAAFIMRLRIPFWPEVSEYGFFPNRNQTSNVLGLGGVMIFAIGLQRLQENRRYWWLWLASLSLLCWALILDASRAGIILFFFGAVAVHIFWWSATKNRRRPLIAFGGLILLIVLFVVDGGATFMRFGKETADFFSATQNFRLSVYQDALNLMVKSPVFGVGLGNFWPIFALKRDYSASLMQTAHPESDWLWAGVDIGWLGLLFAVALFFWWLRQCLPFSPETNRLLRFAAMICGIAFAIHGLFDVSGHRLGALWPALFFGSIAVDPQKEYRRSNAIAAIFRINGLLLLMMGSWWMASAFGAKSLPTSLSVERLRTETEVAIAAENYDKAIGLASEALKVAPLDWNFYYRRGFAEAVSFRARSDAERDFAIARYLLPNWPDLYLKEGETWLRVGNADLAFDIWQEGMRQFPDMAPALYGDIFGVVRYDAAWRESWRKLGESNKRSLLIFLRAADSTEFQLEVQKLVAEKRQLQSFAPDELKALFEAWYEKGDKLWLAQTLQEHPEWKKIAWRQLARTYADYQDYRQAFETAAAFIPQPDVVPQPEVANSSLAESVAGLTLRFRTDPTDSNVGVALAQAQAKEGSIDEGLSTLRVVSRLSSKPKYLPLLEGRLWAQKKDWQKAWEAISKYQNVAER